VDGKQRFRSGSGWNYLKIKTELRLYRDKWGAEWLDSGLLCIACFSMFEQEYIAHPFEKQKLQSLSKVGIANPLSAHLHQNTSKSFQSSVQARIPRDS